MDEIDLQEQLCFNGVGADGNYLFEPMSTTDLAQLASGQTQEVKAENRGHLSELQERNRSKDEAHFGVKNGINVEKLEETGWGLILPAVKAGTKEAALQQEILEALKPLLDWRREQATRKSEKYFQIFNGERGYRPGESKQKYLARLGVGPGPADPERGVPYYLLIVGSPQAISFQVQYQIDVQYAVGRIHFDTIAEYANYARSVVAAEKGDLQLPKDVAFLGVANNDDRATQLSRNLMVEPLADLIQKEKGGEGWKIRRYFDGDATRETLEQKLLGPGAATPALLFTASHGMGFPNGDPRQLRQQGALLCQDWPGPQAWKKPIAEEQYFSADHLRSDANLLGMISFNFACYGGGTPQYNDYSKKDGKQRSAIAPEPFMSGLHKKMLGLEKGGALAAIGHVERAWAYSFMWGTGKRGAAEQQLTVFDSVLGALLKGMPVGAAVEYFNERYAELASDLAEYLEKSEFTDPDPFELANMWTTNNDARGYAIAGDPAVRLQVANKGAAKPRELIELSSFGPGSTGLRATEPAAPASSVASETRAAAAVPPAESNSPAGTSFGLFSSEPKGEVEVPKPGGFQQFVERLTSSLTAAVQDLSRLEVRTYASSNMNADANQSRDALVQAGALRAFTRIMIDGDIDAVVPEKDGVVDTALWGLHLDLVKQAQAHRAEMIKALLNLIKGS